MKLLKGKKCIRCFGKAVRSVTSAKPAKTVNSGTNQSTNRLDCHVANAPLNDVTDFSPFTSPFSRVNRRVAFTLAEVLITLGVIGIVAAMTLPSLIKNTRNTELESRFKKTYSEFSNALQKAGYEQGEPIYGNYSGSFDTDTPIGKIIANQFSGNAKYIHETYNSETGRDNRSFAKDLEYKTFSGDDYSTYNLDDGVVVVNENFYILINNDDYNPKGIQFAIDTNGNKKPNKEGYDLFIFCLAEKDRLAPCAEGHKLYSEYTQEALTNPKYFKQLP